MNLVAIMMDSAATARSAREACAEMANEGLIELGDAVVAFKDADGDVQLDQSVNLTAAGAAGGAWWGVLIGGLAGLAVGNPLLMLAGTAGGAAGGAVGGLFSDAGISDEMMEQSGEALSNGKAILFLMGRTGAPDKVLERLKPFGGKVVSSNLSNDMDTKINAALAEATA